MATKRKAQRSGAINLHLPFVIYVRVSRIGGRNSKDGYISKTLQVAACKKLADENGVKVHAIFKEENVSATSVERPKFQQALQLVRDGVAGGIIVMTLDRFSRDTADGLTLIKDIEAHGGTLYCGDGATTCRTSDGELNTTARLMVATREVGGKREGFERSTAHAISSGRHLAIPYGYMRGTWKKRERVLVAHPEEAPVVKRIFQLRAAGNGWGTIATTLTEEGHLPRTYRRPLKDADGDRTDEWETIQGGWRYNAVRGIVRSRTYLGHAWSGDHEHLNAHEPLVTQKQWDAANYASSTTTGRTNEAYLLTGLVRCANCGYSMVHWRRTPPDKVGKRRRYYVCRGRHAAHKCERPASASAEHLEAFAEDGFMLAAAMLAQLRPVEDGTPVALAEATFQDAQAAYMAALDRLDTLPSGASKTQRKLVQQNHDQKLAALDAAEGGYDKARLSSRSVHMPVKLADLPRLWPSMPLEEKRHLLSLVFACIAVRPRAFVGEGVEQRSLIVPVGDVPGSLSVIDFVVGLDWDPAGTGVKAR